MSFDQRDSLAGAVGSAPEGCADFGRTHVGRTYFGRAHSVLRSGLGHRLARFFVAVSAFLAVALWSAGCGEDTPGDKASRDETQRDETNVASFDGWQLSLREFEAEYSRARGDSALAASSFEERTAFAELLLNKEVLVRVAAESCPIPDAKRERLDRVLYEKNALRRLVEREQEKPNPTPSYFEGLLAAQGLQFHQESFPIVRRGFATLWDSIRVARDSGQRFELKDLRPPLWLFNESELDAPLFQVRDDVETVRDFVVSLRDVDVDHWPTMGDSAKVDQQVEMRVRRLLFLREFERTGGGADEKFQAKMARVRELHLLEQFRSEIRERANLEEADLRAYFEAHREFYKVESADGGQSEETDSDLFVQVRDRVQRNALDERTAERMDEVIAESREARGAKVHLDELR